MTFSPETVKPYTTPIQVNKGNACRHKIIRISLDNPEDVPPGMMLKILPPGSIQGENLGLSTITLPPDSQGFTVYALYKYDEVVEEEITSTLTVSVFISCAEDGGELEEEFNINVRIKPNAGSSSQSQPSGASTFQTINKVTSFGTIVEAEFVEEVEAILYSSDVVNIQLPNVIVRVKENLACDQPIYGVPQSNETFKIKQVGTSFISDGLRVYTYEVMYLGGGSVGENNIRFVFSAYGCGNDEEISKSVLIINENQIQEAIYNGSAHSNDSEIINEALSSGINLDNVSANTTNAPANIRREVILIARALYNDADQTMHLSEILDAVPVINDDTSPGSPFLYSYTAALCFPNVDANTHIHYGQIDKEVSLQMLAANYNLTLQELIDLINALNDGSLDNPGTVGGGNDDDNQDDNQGSGQNGCAGTLSDLSEAITKIASVFNTIPPPNELAGGEIEIGALILLTSVCLDAMKIIFRDPNMTLSTKVTENIFLTAINVTPETLALLARYADQRSDKVLAAVIEAIISSGDIGANLDFTRVITATGTTASEISNVLNIEIEVLESQGVNINQISQSTGKTTQELVDMRDDGETQPPAETLLPPETEEKLNENSLEVTGVDLNGNTAEGEPNFVDQIVTNNIINLDNIVGFTFESFESLIIKEEIIPSIELGYIDWNTDPGEFIFGADNEDNIFYITAKIRRINCDDEINVDMGLPNRNANFNVSLLPNIIKTDTVQSFVFKVEYLPDAQPNRNDIRFAFRNSCGVIEESILVDITRPTQSLPPVDRSLTTIGNQYLIYDKPIILDLNPIGVRRNEIRVKFDEGQFDTCLSGPQFRIGKRVYNMRKDIQVTINGENENLVELDRGISDATIGIEYTGSLEKNAFKGHAGNVNLNFDVMCPPLRNFTAIDSYIDFPNPIQVKIINSSSPDTQPAYLIENVYLKENYNFSDSQIFDVVVNFKLIGGFDDPVIIESPNAEDFNVSFAQNNVIVPNEGNNIIKMRYNGGITNRVRGFLRLKFNAGVNGGIKARAIQLRLNDSNEDFTIEAI